MLIRIIFLTFILFYDYFDSHIKGNPPMNSISPALLVGVTAAVSQGAGRHPKGAPDRRAPSPPRPPPILLGLVPGLVSLLAVAEGDH